MTAKIVDKTHKRSQILQAAVETFVNKGFERATMNDVAEVAGVGKGTIYEYFRNKEEIVAASCDFLYEFIRFNPDLLREPDLTAPAKLRLIFTAFLQFSGAENEALIRLMFHFWGEAIRVPVMETLVFKRLRAYYEEYREILVAIFEQGVAEGTMRVDIDGGSLASVLIGAIDGIFLQSLLEGDWLLPGRSVAALWNLFCRGAFTAAVPAHEKEGFRQGEK